MPDIHIDDEVWKRLQELARPFVDKEPNDVLRRILGLEKVLLSPAVTEKVVEEKEQEVDHSMGNIREVAREWLSKQYLDSNSPIYRFLSGHGVYQYGFDFFKRYMCSSKYFQASESYPGIPVWWLQISIRRVEKPTDPFPYELLVCQKRPGEFNDFWCLAVPFQYLISEYHKGNLDTLRDHICLHLSVEGCTYRGYEVKMFDDVRLTMRKGRKPVPFGQFQL